MNEVLQTIYSRRSVRAYQNKPLPEEVLREIVKAGLYAPSAMNQQSWHFTVLTGKALVQYRAFVREQSGEDAYYGAPAVILVFADSAAREPVRDGTLAISSMMLAAHSLGVGSCWINVVNRIFKGHEAQTLAARWGIPAGYEPVGSIELGYSAQPPKEAAPRRENTVTYLSE